MAEWLIAAVRILSLVLVGGTFAGSLLMQRSARRYFDSGRAPAEGPASPPSVSLISPLRGLDAGLRENFRSFFRQDYPGPCEVLFAVEAASEPAAMIARDVLAEFPGRSGRIAVSEPGPGRAAVGKHANLIAGYRESRHAVIVFCDQDVELPSTFLTEAVEAVSRPETGLAFSAPLYWGARNVPAALYGYAYNPLSILFHGALAGMRILKTAIGSVMAFRRDVFEEIGGAALLEANPIGDDMVLGRAIRQSGCRIVLLKTPVRIHLPRQSLKGLFLHFHRWFVIIEHYIPWSPALFFLFAYPLFWSAVTLAAGAFDHRGSFLGLVLIAASLARDGLMQAFINARWLGERRWWKRLWIAALFEPLFFPIFVSSLLIKKIRWRGETWTVARGRAG